MDEERLEKAVKELFDGRIRRPDVETDRNRKGVLGLKDVVAHDGDVGAALREKQRQAVEEYERTGSLPEWWDLRVPLKKAGRPPKFSCPEEFLSKGLGYLEQCLEEERLPTTRGLALWMGFHTWSAFNDYARRNVEFRIPHGQLLLAIQALIERMLAEGKGNPAGRKFLLTNIPDGFELDDATDAKLRFSWKEKQQTELVGEDGGPIRVSRDVPPEEGYLRMLEGGKLEEGDVIVEEDSSDE